MPSVALNEQYMNTLYSVYLSGGTQYTHAISSSRTNLWGMPGVRTTASNPHWRDKILAGQDASLPYSLRQLLDWKVKRTSLVCSKLPLFELCTSDMMYAGSTSIPVNVTDEVLRDQALTRLKRKLQNEVKSFEALVPLAEARDLSRTVRSATSLTTDLVKTLLEIKRTRGASAARYASKAWLTYGFGIRPILSDIQSLNAAITSYLNRSDRVIRLVGGASKTWVSEITNGGVTFNRFASASARTVIEHTLSYRYVSGFNLPLKSSNSYGAHQQFGTDLPSLVPALWEATAFSWIADYFGTVGEYLSDTFESPPGYPRYVTLNRLYIAKLNCSITPVFFDLPVQVISRTDGSATGTYLEFDRTVIPGTTLPRRLLRFKTADEIGYFGVTKLLNLASLLVK